uniref:Uncharacterized protein n=1 Tax=Anguilla anguilla TaxID=7936 RepID=A0A0E9XDM8_ANGAN
MLFTFSSSKVPGVLQASLPLPKKHQRSILFISLANFQLELIKTIRYKSSLMDEPPSVHIVF